MTTTEGFWIESNSLWLYISQNVGVSVEIYPTQNRSAISMLCRVGESNNEIQIFPQFQTELLTVDEARSQASVLMKAVDVANDWKTYQQMMNWADRSPQ
jgi:hypothetical protein